MLIQKLVKTPQLKLQLLLLHSQLKQQELMQEKQQFAEKAQAFIGSPTGLLLSFTAGCLFRLRHTTTVKVLRSLLGVRWLRLVCSR
jgi:hypothetical protein